ncbi:MAG: serine/threonine-protein kinase, partial [Patulibacter sp.]
MPRVVELPAVDATVGDWLIEATIAEGGSATVYRARHLHDGRTGALKLAQHGASRAARQRFARGADALATLQHPRIPALLDRGALPDGTPWLAETLIDGEPLADQIARGAELPVATLAEQLGDALSHLHQRGFVHRDLSPRNILITPNGDPYLIDLGIVHGGDTLGFTADETILGTVGYAAPEQLHDAASAGPPADLYGLAACIFTALTGCAPHPGQTPREVLSRRLHGGRLQLAAASDEAHRAVRLVEAGLADDPAARPTPLLTWSQQLADAIEQLGPGPLARHFTTSSSDVTQELGAPRRTSRRRPVGRRHVLAALTFAALLAAGGWVALHRSAGRSDHATTAGMTLPNGQLTLPPPASSPAELEPTLRRALTPLRHDRTIRAADATKPQLHRAARADRTAALQLRQVFAATNWDDLAVTDALIAALRRRAGAVQRAGAAPTPSRRQPRRAA